MKFTGGDNNEKTGFEFRSISIDRTKMSEEEAFEHAIEMIQTRQMGFRKAADFFSVSKWKLYKTARKRGIYAEIKKQNQAQVNKNQFSLGKKKLTNIYVFRNFINTVFKAFLEGKFKFRSVEIFLKIIFKKV